MLTYSSLILLAFLTTLNPEASGNELPPVDLRTLQDENARVFLAMDFNLAQPLLREIFNPEREWLRSDNLPHQLLCTFSIDSITKTSCCKVLIIPRRRLGTLCDDLNALLRPEWLCRVLRTRFTTTDHEIVAAEDRVPVDNELLQTILAQKSEAPSERVQLEGNHAIEVLIDLDDGMALTVLPCLVPSSDFLRYNLGAGLGPMSNTKAPPLAKELQTYVHSLPHMRTIRITGDFQDEHTLKLHVAITRRVDSDGWDDTRMAPQSLFVLCPWLFFEQIPAIPIWVQHDLKPDPHVPMTVSGDFVIDKFDLRFKVALDRLSRVLDMGGDLTAERSDAVEKKVPNEELERPYISILDLETGEETSLEKAGSTCVYAIDDAKGELRTFWQSAAIGGCLIRTVSYAGELREKKIVENLSIMNGYDMIPDYFPATGKLIQHFGEYIVVTVPGEESSRITVEGYVLDVDWVDSERAVAIVAASGVLGRHPEQIYLINVNTQEKELVATDLRCNVSGGILSADRHKYAFLQIHDGMDELNVLDLRTRELRSFLSREHYASFHGMRWSPDGKRIVWGCASIGRRPPSSFEWMDTADGTVTPIANAPSFGFGEFRFVFCGPNLIAFAPRLEHDRSICRVLDLDTGSWKSYAVTSRADNVFSVAGGKKLLLAQ